MGSGAEVLTYIVVSLVIGFVVLLMLIDGGGKDGDYSAYNRQKWGGN